MQVQLFGTPASDTSWHYWHHSTQHARQVGYSALLEVNVTTWLSLGLEAEMVFPSDHPVTVWTEYPNTNSFLQYQQ